MDRFCRGRQRNGGRTSIGLGLSLCAACAAAPTETEETIFYEDGSYLVVTVAEPSYTVTLSRDEQGNFH